MFRATMAFVLLAALALAGVSAAFEGDDFSENSPQFGKERVVFQVGFHGLRGLEASHGCQCASFLIF